MPLRPCLVCGTPTNGSRCPKHKLDRKWGRPHRRVRAEWEPLVAAGQVDCWRCGKRIQPGQPWDLGHDDNDRSVYRGPECIPCNRATHGR